MISPEESLIEFPCQFPIKAMGPATPEFDTHVFEIIKRHAPDTHERALKSRLSKNGNFKSITITINALNRAQLDAIYQDLSDSESVSVAL